MAGVLDLLPDYPYLPRLAVKGRIYLGCPSCGLVTVNRVRAGQSRIQCRGELDGCRHSTYGWGMRIYPLGKGNYRPPHDITMVNGLREAFPVGEMFRWKSGEMVHQLVPDGPLRRELLAEFVRQVRSKAVGGLAGLGAAFEQVVGEWGLDQN